MLSRKFAGTGMWCGWLLAALYLALLPLEVLADPPLVESPPLTMVDGIDRFKRKMLLRNATLITPIWLDDRYVIATTPPEPERNQGPPELPPSAWVKIDTETGKIERMSWRRDRDVETRLECMAGDRIMLTEHILNGKGRGPLIWKVGKQGGPFKEYVIENALGNELPKEWTEQGLIIGACELTKWPTHLIPKGSGYLRHLMPGHGWTLLRASWDMPKTPGDTFVWIKPDGSTLQIPLTEGETNPGGGIYIAYENAYFIQPAELHYGSPQKRWTPHYARLLHLDGRIDLFPVPEPIIKMVSVSVGNGTQANAIYTRRGPLWYLSVSEHNPDVAKLKGYYLVIGKELVRVTQGSGRISKDGCKLLGESERTPWEIRHPHLARPFDYFVIDLCKDN